MTSMNRAPFDLPSGCGSISVPEIAVPSLCSLPPLTSPGVSPKPFVFNIPELPNVPVEQACIDITPRFSVAVAGFGSGGGGTGGFRTASGYSDCLDGRYVLSMALNVPCALGGVPTKAVVENNYASKPNFGSLAIQRAAGSCAIQAISLHLNVPAGCGGITFSNAVAVRTMDRGTAPSVDMKFFRKGNGMSGRKPDACAFKLSMNLAIPAGCNAASYSVRPTMYTATRAPTIYARVGRPPGNPSGCQFRIDMNVALPTVAFHGCPVVDVKNVLAKEDDGARQEPSAKIGFNRKKNGTCDYDFSFALDLPRVMLDGDAVAGVAPNGVPDFDIDIDNAPLGAMNHRSFSLNLKLPGYICSQSDVMTISRVNMEFLKNVSGRVWRHVSVSIPSCVTKRVRVYPGKISANPRYTHTCVERCSRKVMTSIRLPWWVYRARTRRPDVSSNNISIRISLPDGSEGDATISVWMSLPCPDSMFSITAGGGLSMSVSRKTSGCGAKYNMFFTGKATSLVRYGGFSLTSSGFFASRYIDYYRHGLLVSVKADGRKKLFDVNTCQ